MERQKTAEKERLFLVYAKQWWREYLQIRPSHNSRLVKIFAQVCILYEKVSQLYLRFTGCKHQFQLTLICKMYLFQISENLFVKQNADFVII